MAASSSADSAARAGRPSTSPGGDPTPGGPQDPAAERGELGVLHHPPGPPIPAIRRQPRLDSRPAAGAFGGGALVVAAARAFHGRAGGSRRGGNDGVMDAVAQGAALVGRES